MPLPLPVKEVMPEANDLITVAGREVPIMADVDESGLVGLLRSVPAPHQLKVRAGRCPLPFSSLGGRVADLCRRALWHTRVTFPCP
jgi:hypothetical protein